eukprot:jgi/Astpho2/3413/e_gw1.00054.14.1_t
MARGSKRQLQPSDLFPLPSAQQPKECTSVLWGCWQQSAETGRLYEPSLLFTIARAYGLPYLGLGFLKLGSDILNLAGPLLLTTSCALVVQALLNSHYSYQQGLLACKLRAAVTCIVFKKTLLVSAVDMSAFSTGMVQTLMSVDADRVVNLCMSLHDLWSLPVQIGIALFLLYTQVKYAFLAGLAVVLLLVPINRWLALKIQRASEDMMAYKDVRVKVLAELLRGIHQIKMCVWEQGFVAKVNRARQGELEALAVRKYLDALCVYFWAATSLLFSIVTFGLFVLLGHQLTPEIVFTSLALFNVLIAPLNSLPWVLNGVVEALVSVRRLQRFLMAWESKADWAYAADNQVSQKPTLLLQVPGYTQPQLKSQPGPALQSVSLTLSRGSLTVLHGEVGAGKSSLLAALLGEMEQQGGHCRLDGRAAYVGQQAWVMSGSVRQVYKMVPVYNYMDFDRYTAVLEACALSSEVTAMPYGDLTLVGERGTTLSGGQRVRLALARAVYQDCDVYMLDDVLSAVDAHMADWLVKHLIQGPLLADKTRIVATHSELCMAAANQVVKLFRGKAMLTPAVGGLAQALGDSGTELPAIIAATADTSSPVAQVCLASSPSEIQQEQRQIGHVRWAVYASYGRAVGLRLSLLVFLSLLLMQASRNANDLWLSFWVSHKLQVPHSALTPDVKFYLYILVSIAAANSVFTLVRAFSFAFGGLAAAQCLHEQLLQAVIMAPCRFFDITSAGRVLNRFSSDTATADDSLPFIMNILFANLFGLAGILVVLCLSQPLLLPTLLPLGLMYRYLQQYYRQTAREVRRLSNTARSPVYATFSEALDGAVTIRAFGAQKLFADLNEQQVAALQQASFAGIATSQWLGLRLQLIAAVLVTLIGVMAIAGNEDLLPGFHGAGEFTASKSAMLCLLGLSLSYALPITGLLSAVLSSSAETEQEMVSVERIEVSTCVAPEQSQQWLRHHGASPQARVAPPDIVFLDVHLRYNRQGRAALTSVNLHLPSGLKYGVCGRTGAGKSSLIAALLRLTEIAAGQILIGGRDTRQIPLQVLRQLFGVVPQTPFLFQGTVRENLDPMKLHKDKDMIAVLRAVQLWDILCGIGLSLRKTPTRPHLFLSWFCAGQQQLLCLARVLLAQPSIVLLDECTANVDPETSRIMHELLASVLRGCTIIQVAHGLDSVMECDVAIVMDGGQVVEQGPPKELLQTPDSALSNLWHARKAPQ